MADLILCADRDAVSKVLRATPRVRPSVFTMIEAATLAGRVVSELSDGWDDGVHNDRGSMPRGADPVVRLRWLVSEMDASRGQIPLSEMGRMHRLRRKSHDDPTEILDVHSRGDRAHKRMLRDVSGVTGDLAKAVIAVHQLPVSTLT
jgi:hypothetical protein